MPMLTVMYDRDDQEAGASGYKLRVRVTGAVGMAREVFVYNRRPATAGAPQVDVFDHVASSVDMEDVAPTAPPPTSPWYRSDEAEFYFMTLAERDDMVRIVREDLDMLTAALGLSYSVTELVEHGAV